MNRLDNFQDRLAQSLAKIVEGKIYMAGGGKQCNESGGKDRACRFRDFVVHDSLEPDPGTGKTVLGR